MPGFGSPFWIQTRHGQGNKASDLFYKVSINPILKYSGSTENNYERRCKNCNQNIDIESGRKHDKDIY